MKRLISLIFILSALQGITQDSIYDYRITSVSGQVIDFNDFRGKLIMIVNTASGSERNKQLQQLDTLSQLFLAKGLVVVAFPSNDFSNEEKTNTELQSFAGNHPSFFVAEKSSVKGQSISPLFRWCTKKMYNGSLDTEVRGDFQKFIINREGKIMAIYSGIVSPLDSSIIKMIDVN